MLVGYVAGLTVVTAIVFSVASFRLRVRAIRADRRGDEVTGQSLRVVAFRLRLTMITVFVLALAIVAVSEAIN